MFQRYTPVRYWEGIPPYHTHDGRVKPQEVFPYRVISQFTLPLLFSKQERRRISVSEKLKISYATSPEKQVAEWLVRFPHLKGGVDIDALNRARLQAKQSQHSFVCVLPKLGRIFDENESSLYLDLQFLEILGRSCKEQSVRLHNELPRMNGEMTLAKKERYRDFQESNAGQRGDFVVFTMDLGQGCPYREGMAIIHSKDRLPLPLGIIAAALSVQKMEALWKYNPNMWAASLTTEIDKIDKRKKNRFELPCFFFEKSFGDKDILCLSPLSTLFYYNGGEKSHGGFSTALRTE